MPGVLPAMPFRGLEPVAAEFPTVVLGAEGTGNGSPRAVLWQAEWEQPRFDFYAFDARMDTLAEQAAGGPFLLWLGADPEELPRMALEVVTRCQRLAGRRNAASGFPEIDAVLARHRALHDLSRPLVRAGYAHALDVWQWMLRLQPDAGLEVQIAGLFHDIEAGARMAEELLAEAGLEPEARRRVERLIAAHERMPAPGDPDAADLALLNDADALSFFSLNSPGYWDSFGPEATRRKVAFTLARLRPEAKRRLRWVRLRPEVRQLAAPLAPDIFRGAQHPLHRSRTALRPLRMNLVRPRETLDRFLSGGSRVLVVVAHPDDETIGAGALLARLRDVRVVHVTDGAPRDPQFFAQGFTGSREEYDAGKAPRARGGHGTGRDRPGTAADARRHRRPGGSPGPAPARPRDRRPLSRAAAGDRPHPRL